MSAPPPQESCEESMKVLRNGIKKLNDIWEWAVIKVLIVVRYGITFTKSMSLRISYSLGIPLSYIACVLPVAGTFMVLGSIERLLNIVEISKRQEEER